MTKLPTRIAAFLLPFTLMAGLLLAASEPAEAGRFKRLYLPPGQGEFVPLPPGANDYAQGQNYAQSQDYGDPNLGMDPGLDGGGISIRPREAAQIARQAVPGAKVLNVKLLPSGIYAVTLRGGGRLTRVMVDGRSGDIL